MYIGRQHYSAFSFSLYYFTGVAALNQYIYVVGGYDGHRQLNRVERYDTESDNWDSVASIRVARSALSVTVLDGRLYAMGKLLLLL
jgi:kelch-like protein 19